MKMIIHNNYIRILVFIQIVLVSCFLEKSKIPFDGSNFKEDFTVDGCFCQLKGLIDDCSCSVESIDNFNNVQIFPVLNSLLTRDFFRYWKVNLNKDCPFWPDDSRCSVRYCSVEKCSEVPEALKDCSGDEHLGYINDTLSDESRAGFEVWAAHDSAQDDSFCEPEDDKSPGSDYVDLLANPERYTGYAGPSAHRLWKTIYDENCFRPEGSSSPSSPFSHLASRNSLTAEVKDMCLEKRTFYRAISGLHSSINIHLCSMYLLDDGKGFSSTNEAKWGPNVQEFRRRFDPTLTDGAGTEYLKNLYFVYLIELRAIAKAGDQLKMMQYFTGNSEEDLDTKEAVQRLVKTARSFQHFDESNYFSNGQATLKEEFRKHFRNVTRIMDCVGCDKCKLWGKLQVTGLGTALKILFSDNFKEILGEKPSKLQLTRSEVVALVNALGRLSRSIVELESFRLKGQDKNR